MIRINQINLKAGPALAEREEELLKDADCQWVTQIQAAYGALFEGLPAWTVLMGAAMAAVLVSAYSSRVFRALEGPLPG